MSGWRREGRGSISSPCFFLFCPLFFYCWCQPWYVFQPGVLHFQLLLELGVSNSTHVKWNLSSSIKNKSSEMEIIFWKSVGCFSPLQPLMCGFWPLICPLEGLACCGRNAKWRWIIGSFRDPEQSFKNNHLLWKILNTCKSRQKRIVSLGIFITQLQQL